MVIVTGCGILSNSFIASIEMILFSFIVLGDISHWFFLLTHSQTRNKSHFVTVYNSFNVKKKHPKKHITSMVMVIRFRTSQKLQVLTPSPLFRPGLENFHSTDKDLFYTFQSPMIPVRQCRIGKKGRNEGAPK